MDHLTLDWHFLAISKLRTATKKVISLRHKNEQEVRHINEYIKN